MSIAGLKKRLLQLEQQSQIDGHDLTLTLADGEQVQIAGRNAHFLRLAAVLGSGGSHGELDILRRATRLEGANREAFALLRALAVGPAEEEDEHGGLQTTVARRNAGRSADGNRVTTHNDR